MKKIKITPKIKEPKNYVGYETLITGATFIHNGELWMKTDDIGGAEQVALCLHDGLLVNGMCSQSVLPVDVALTWKKQD